MIQLIRPQKMDHGKFINEYVVDTFSDINNINLENLLMGSCVYVIEPGDLYILNSGMEWRKV